MDSTVHALTKLSIHFDYDLISFTLIVILLFGDLCCGVINSTQCKRFVNTFIVIWWYMLWWMCYRYKNGMPLANTSRTKIRQNGDVYTLVLDDVTDSDKGKITAEIKNALGTETCHCDFKVVCKFSYYVPWLFQSWVSFVCLF